MCDADQAPLTFADFVWLLRRATSFKCRLGGVDPEPDRVRVVRELKRPSV